MQFEVAENMNEELEQENEFSKEIKDIESNIENSVWIKNSTKLIAIFTFVCTIAVFIVRGFWYLYTWGYFNAIGIDRMYINVEDMGILYCVLGYLGVVAIVFVSNYIAYTLWIKGPKWYIGVLLLIELVFFWGIVLLTSYADLGDIFYEIVKLGMGIDYLLLTLKMILILITFNLYGLLFGVIKEIQEKKTDINNGMTSISIKLIIVEVLIIIIANGVWAFCIGMDAGHEKKGYKLVVEKVEHEELVEERYLINWNDDRARIYPVLFENKDIFIISYLCVGKNGIYIESNRQQTISKEGIETIYCEDIYKIGKNISDNQMDEKKEKNKMTETLWGAIVGAIMGALFTGICTYLIEEIKRRKSKAMQESHAAAMLYYDLKSIEDYLKSERSSVNIRYTTRWQEMVSNCNFLEEVQIAYLYRIYDEVYNYNYHYNLREKTGLAVNKGEIAQYLTLQEMFQLKKVTDKSRKEDVKKYNTILKELEKYKKR